MASTSSCRRRDGPRYGLRLKDQIGTRLELRLGDPAESEMDRKRARQLAQSPPGRGITADGREFVIAVPRIDTALADELRARFGGRVAPPIEVLPERVEYDDLLARSPGPRPRNRDPRRHR